MGSRDTLFLHRTAGYAVVLIGMILSQCTCQNNRPDEPAVAAPPPGPPARDAARAADEGAIELPPALRTGDLDKDEKRVLFEVLSEQYDPCGKPKSFLESLEDPETCDLAKGLGDMAVEKVAQGLSKRQIARALLEEQARRAAHVTFVTDDTPTWGDAKEPRHVVVEFFDFECPHCKTASGPTRELVAKYDSVLYPKFYPLTRIHQHAQATALAALAAFRQGKFWEAYEAIFEHQDELHAAPAESDIVRRLMSEVGLDMAQYDRDVQDPKTAARVARDVAEAEQANIEGTPTFFVDGVMVDYEALEAALKAAPAKP
ncbi:MAG: hypothetical protein EP329_13710 [Deltaproteobacteria bacterium]|nr:MAG: hypothetical protein EP329_13710 [Deltaproteobacteria bacterium]